MELAEAAQREALRDTRPPAPPPVIRSPGLPDLPTTYRPAPVRDTTFAELFERISRCVRQAVLLEARLDSDAFGLPAPQPTWSTRQPGSHPASPATEREPGDGTGLYYERLEDDLAIGSSHTPETILAGIGAKLDQARQGSRPEPQPSSPTPPGTRPNPKPA